MKILHTSDWHLGRSLYGRKRYDEFSAFLDWLARTIEDEDIDVLLVAGDVFDTGTPSNRAQALYYRFLGRISSSCCRHVVVTAGNHDSPSFLNAPGELLKALNVYVIGSMTQTLEDEVIVLKKNPQVEQMEADNVDAIVCAVPYLRDKDVRSVEPGETIDDRSRKLVKGIKEHYGHVVKIAQEKKDGITGKSAGTDPQTAIPIIAMGHLFTAGGKTVDHDGVRELYVGSLAHVHTDIFPLSIDYLALGHLHVPQSVGGLEHIRYSGSPIPMGYGEASQQKYVVILDFGSGKSNLNHDVTVKNKKPEIKLFPVPCFQQLVSIEGSLNHIHEKIEELKSQKSSAWLEIEYTGKKIIANLQDILDEAIADSAMEILRIKNRRLMERVISSIREDETLDDLDAGDVFSRCLDVYNVPDEDREELTDSYNQIIKDLLESDENAE